MKIEKKLKSEYSEPLSDEKNKNTASTKQNIYLTALNKILLNNKFILF